MATVRDFREAPPKEICVVRLSALGDAVRVLPVVNALKRAWPTARITWVIQPLPYRLVRGHPSVDRFFVVRRPRGVGEWWPFVSAGLELRQQPFDLLLALHVSAKAGILTGFARADVKLGFDRHRARELNWLVTNEKIAPHPAQHIQDQYFEFLHRLGVDPEPVEWRIPIAEEERAAQRRFFDGLDRPAAAVAVGTSRPEKNWTPAQYVRVIESLAGDFGMRPVLVGGPSGSERAMADAIMAATRVPVVDMLGDDLRRLVWLLDGASLAISPDTAPFHLARALDTPVVGLFGYSNPKRAGPYRKYGDLVVDGYARYPGEDYPPIREYRPGGMERVRVEDVLEKVALARERYA